MTIGSLYIKPMGVALMFVPFILAFLSVWLRLALHRHHPKYRGDIGGRTH